MKCVIDVSKWKDYDLKFFELFGYWEVWGGFDFVYFCDGVFFVVIVFLLFEGEKYCLLECY